MPEKDTAASPALPPGWTAIFDSTYNCNYFHHTLSGKTQWELPIGDPTNPATYAAPQRALTEDNSEVTESPRRASKDDNCEVLAPSTALPQPTGGGIEECRPGLVSRASGPRETPPPQAEGSIENGQKEEYTEGTPPETEQGSPLDENQSGGGEVDDGSNDGGENESEQSSANKKWIGGSSQDYVHLAEMYRLQREYADPKANLNCVLYKKRPCSDVFFPCQHRCLCPECIVTSQVVEHHHMALVPHGHCNCPLCGSVIKKIIPSAGGAEVDAYWNWVCEVNPHLPDGFLRNFRHSAAVIQKVYVVDNNKDNEPSRACVVS